MKKAADKLVPEIKGASVILMLLDARCPISSLNPDLDKIFENKPLLYILNKADLASVKISGQWVSYLEKQGRKSLLVSCKDNMGRKKLLKFLEESMGRCISHQKKRNRQQLFRIIAAGVPNTGKSSLINMLSPIKSAKTGKKPGLTRGKQWLKIKEGFEILDSPGIMPHRTDHPDALWKLGAIAAIKQEILPVEEIAVSLLKYLTDNNILPIFLKELLSSETVEDGNRVVTFEENLINLFAQKQGFLSKGGEIDRERACYRILKTFREGGMGRLSLETPPEFPESDGIAGS